MGDDGLADQMSRQLVAEGGDSLFSCGDGRTGQDGAGSGGEQRSVGAIGSS